MYSVYIHVLSRRLYYCIYELQVNSIKSTPECLCHPSKSKGECIHQLHINVVYWVLCACEFKLV